tara:strand:+ start:418 stop:732 length:315 start_codon:yes stop_codon:yes gene_type:complete
MAKGNIWEDKNFSKLSEGLEKVVTDNLVEPSAVTKTAKKRNPTLSKEAKKVTKWKDGLKDIVKKPMMIEKHIHIRMKRYCVDKEINIFDYTCDLIDRDLKKYGF